MKIKQMAALFMAAVLVISLLPVWQLNANAASQAENQPEQTVTPETSVIPGPPVIQEIEPVSSNTTRAVTASGECGDQGDNVTWTLYDDGELVIEGSGNMADYTSNSSVPWYSAYRSSITKVTIRNGVTGIGNYAFFGCTKLGEISLPGSVSSIGEFAFYRCSRLKSIAIPCSITNIGTSAFDQCSNLDAVYISDLVGWCSIQFTNVSSNPLYLAGNLYLDGQLVTDLTVPEGITAISTYAFYGCTSLTSVALPNSLTAIHDNAFSKCTGLTSVTFPRGLTAIGQDAFSGCTGLTSAILPDSLTVIESFVFYNCSNLSTVVLPSSLTTIEMHAFAGCSRLTSITIPSSVTAIGNSAFSGCSGLESVYIQDLTRWCGIQFPDTTSTPMHYAENLYLNGELVTDVTVPDDVTAIGSFAFMGWDKLNSITIPNTVQSIGWGAFRDCHGLSGITIPDSVTTIGNEAFSNCDGLQSITLSNKLTALSTNMLAHCTGLTDITIPDSVTHIDGFVFYGCTGIQSITVPVNVETVNSYAFCGFADQGVIKFQGDAPTFERYAFSDSTVTVYYPENNATWTEEVMQNYSGTVTWVPYSTVVASGDCGAEDSNVSWTLHCYGELVIDGSGKMADYALPVDAPWYETHRSLINRITIGEGITGIGENAFCECGQLKEIRFVGDAPTFHPAAFRNVTATAYYPAGNDTWTEDVLQDYGGDITWVSYRLVVASGYYGNEGENVAWTLYNDGELMIEGTGKMATYLDYEMVPWYASYRSAIKKVTIREGVTSICHWAFYGCTNLTSITIPDTVTYIGCRAFDSCTGLTSIAIPSSVTMMDEYAFKNCTGLTGVYIEDLASWCAIYFDSDISSPLTFAGNLYLNGELVVDLVMPDDIASIGDAAFTGCTSLRSVVLPNGITQLGYYAFANCPNLTSVSLPDNLIVIGHNAFRNCTGLTSITLPDSIERIDSSAFYGCTGLEALTMPRSVNEVMSYAFHGCTGLKEIKFLGDAPYFSDSAFENLTTTVRYPAENTTWTEEVMQNYSGTITWVPYGEVEKPTFSAKGVTLSFQDEIFMSVYFVPSNTGSVVGYGLITFNGKVTPDMSLAVTRTEGSVINGNMLGVTSTGIPAKNMGDKMYFAIYAELTDGTYAYSNCYSYSPIDYAYNLLGKASTSESMKSLIVAMLNYGAAAQVHFGHNTDNLVNSRLTAEQQALVSPYDASMISDIVKCADSKKSELFAAGNTGFSSRNPSVTFEGAFALNFYLSIDPQYLIVGDMDFYIWKNDTYNSVEQLTLDNADVVTTCELSGSVYRGVVAGITAKEVDETVYCAAVFTDTDGNTYTSGIIAYSLGAYVKSQADKTGTMAAFAQATGVYSYYAKMNFGS